MKKVTVTAQARLHLGFIDLGGALGRNFGSVGVGLGNIGTSITVTGGDSLQVKGESCALARRCAVQFCLVAGVADKLHIVVESAIGEHIGLGSGTQMALAVGVGISAFYGLAMSCREVATITGRGKRSGIGIGVFEQGGLLVDGGKGEASGMPPVVARMDLPSDWCFILLFDGEHQGLHGDYEKTAFAALPPQATATAAHLCHLLLMQGLPAVAEGDIGKFGVVIDAVQMASGEHFGNQQGGAFASGAVAGAVAWLRQQGVAAAGQTSWGPTGFCLVDAAVCGELVRLAKDKFPNLTITCSHASNTGAKVSIQQ